ncbi:sialidase family protein [Candidatus Chloroploca sp. Khr17]|uniref:sialidase family protein n=1 Tax=Candidatus Chloroploca sp. Khr17 TaxID=2496869 RepID=UPI0013EB4065|nr:sialidase family protein [Candidatus Chloroploca sp. Khr17]
MMKRSLLVLVLLLVALAGWSQPARAQNWCTTAVLTGQIGNQTVVRSLASGSGAILAGTGPNAQIWRSLDNGASWTLIRSFDGQTDVWSLASLGNGVFLAATAGTGQIWRSTDNGGSWVLTFEYGAGITHVDIGAFPDVVLAAGSTGSSGTFALYRSVDAGLTWSAPSVSPGPVPVGSRAFFDLGDELLFFSRATASLLTPHVWASADRGNTWLYRGLVGTAVLSTLALSSDLYVYGGTSGTGQIWRSTDNGGSWTFLSSLAGTGRLGLLSNQFMLSAAASFYRGDGVTWDLIHTTNQDSFQSFVQLDANSGLFGSQGSAQIWRVSMAPCPTPSPTPGPTATPAPTPIGIIEYPPDLDDQTFGDLTIGMYAVMDHVVEISTHPTGLAILSLIFLVMFFQALRIFMIKRGKP